MAVEGFFENKKEPVEAKVGELTPQSRAVNITAKVVSKTEIREIPMGRDGSAHKVSDALVGDETGVVYLTLWDDNIEKVNDGDTIRIENGYVTLFKGNIRLNIGKYGKLEPAAEPLAVEVNTENNVSSKTYEQQRRPYRSGGGGRGGGRGYGGGGGGYGGRDRRGGGGGYGGGRDSRGGGDRRGGGGGYRPRY
ncbi:MAG: single-stranded DNA-binding protein [Candidatus Bathyarchaeia archaeon]